MYTVVESVMRLKLSELEQVIKEKVLANEYSRSPSDIAILAYFFGSQVKKYPEYEPIVRELILSFDHLAFNNLEA